MFQLFSGISLKGWLVIAAVVAALAAVGVYQYRGHQVTDLKEQVKEQSITIQSQNDAIETDSKVDAIQEKTQVETQKAVQETNTWHDQHQRDRQNMRESIDRAYDGLPTTTDNVTRRYTEIERANIEALWGSYCHAKPSDPQCAALKKD